MKITFDYKGQTPPPRWHMYKPGATDEQRQRDFYECRARARYLPPDADHNAFIFDCLRSKGYTITFTRDDEYQ